MEEVVVVGIDLAKSVFQVHGVDAHGKVVLRQRLSRARLLPFFMKLPACLIGMETCASANHWARELIALGHEVRLMPPHYVKPYVKRSKNDASDAEAICEAVTRPTMRFVGVKSPEQQSVLVLHRTRLILTRQRTQIGNAIRAHLAEFGIVAPVGRQGLDRLFAVITDPSDTRVPVAARACLSMLAASTAWFLPTCSRPTGRSGPTAGRPSSAGACRRSLASGRWLRARWWRACPIRASSGPAVACPHGSAWCLGRTHRAARSGSAASPRRATPICDGCCSSGPWR